jgi:DHA1 family multidrug resistance protein-like MFS transporter
VARPGTIIPYLPVFLLEQAHASVSLIGLVAAAYFLGVFAFSAYLGQLSDRVGRKPMIIAGTVLYTVATALFVTTTDPVWFIVFRFVEGVGAAAVVPAAQAFVADITENENRSRAYGWLTSAQFSGLIIGPALAWPLYALGGGHARSRRAPRRTRQTPAAARVALQAGACHRRGGGIV